jgi:hypothetical protein
LEDHPDPAPQLDRVHRRREDRLAVERDVATCRMRGNSSWSRLMERRKVDFPHPDGPIRAVTAFGLTSSVTSKSACLAPYQKEYAFAARAPMKRTVPPGVTR